MGGLRVGRCQALLLVFFAGWVSTAWACNDYLHLWAVASIEESRPPIPPQAAEALFRMLPRELAKVASTTPWLRDVSRVTLVSLEIASDEGSQVASQSPKSERMLETGAAKGFSAFPVFPGIAELFPLKASGPEILVVPGLPSGAPAPGSLEELRACAAKTGSVVVAVRFHEGYQSVSRLYDRLPVHLGTIRVLWFQRVEAMIRVCDPAGNLLYLAPTAECTILADTRFTRSGTFIGKMEFRPTDSPAVVCDLSGSTGGPPILATAAVGIASGPVAPGP